MRDRFTRTLGVLGLAALAAVPAAAAGAVVQFEFSGVIESSFGSIGATPASAFQGVPFTGHVLFDSDAVDEYPATSGLGVYSFLVPPFAFHAQVGGAVFDSPSLRINVVDDAPAFSGADLYDILASQAFGYPGAAGHQVSVFSLTFFDAAGGVFSSDALPLVPPALGLFADPSEDRSFTVQGCTDAHLSGGTCSPYDFGISGDVVSFTLPEPSASACVALAALCLVAASRRRR